MATDTRHMEPVFIVGALRSGTTLFRLMLDHHPQVSMVGEFEESVEMLGDDGWANIEEYRLHLQASTQLRAAGLRVDLSLDYPSLVHDVWRQACALTPKPIVGASIHSRFDRCPDLWPRARYLHVIRDPRDVARSCIGMGWVGNVFHGAQVWIDAERRFATLASRIAAENHYEVRYEALVRDPEAVLRGVCDYLRIDYSAQMLSYDGDTTYSRPDPKLVEQWRTKQTPREVQHVEWRCGELLRERGYRPSEYGPHEPSAAERLYLGVHNRLQKVRMGVERYGPALWLMDRAALRVGPRQLRHRIALRKNEIDKTHHK